MFSVQIKLKYIRQICLRYLASQHRFTDKNIIIINGNDTTKPVSKRVNGSYDLLGTYRPDITFLKNPS